MKTFTINDSAAPNQRPARLRVSEIAVIAAVVAALGAGCAGGNDFRQLRATADKGIPHVSERAAQPERTQRENVRSFDDFDEFETRSPKRPGSEAPVPADAQATGRRALEQFENFRNQQAHRAAQAQLVEAWNRALITAAWQQAIQQQLLSGQAGGYQSNQGQRRVLSTYDLTGTGVYEGVGVMTPSGSWYPGQ